MLRKHLGIVTLVLAVLCSATWAEMNKVQRPFILWTAEDIRQIRKTIENEDWAKKAWKDLQAHRNGKVEPFRNLLKYAVFGDKDAGLAEKKELMRMVNSPAPQGMAQWINCIRYDQLHELLSEEEKAKCEKVFREYIDLAIHKRDILDPKIFNDSRNFSRYDARKYTRSNWLPNIIWPRKVSANLMAVALADEDLIRETWKAYGSMKWYFDHYLSDKGFYQEEFSKMGSTPGAMLMYCRGLDRLGLDEMGYGYTGGTDKESGIGATMKGHIETLMDLGYPRLEIHSSRPQFPMVTMGDLRQGGSSRTFNLPSAAFQHSIVMGYIDKEHGGDARWAAHGAWGGTIRGKHPQWDGYSNFTPKMMHPLWFEICHKRWPKSGFGYFLAQMRAPDEKQYIPSLYFGLEPIDPDKVKAPPAPSAVWPERGVVMLRAEESPKYWTSPKPAVSMRTATPYAHSVRDSLAIMGFYAMNRPILLNRQVTPGYAKGWSRSAQSHNTIVVDDAEPAFTTDVSTRSHFSKKWKFASTSSSKIYEGVDLSRTLVLTDDYLLDIVDGKSEKPRSWTLFIHALGRAKPEDETRWSKTELPGKLTKLAESRKMDPDADAWSLTILQDLALDDPSKAKMPAEWYKRKVGDRITMLGQEGTEVYTARTPRHVRSYRNEEGKKITEEYPSEVGGVTLAVRREGKSTRYVTLHQPFGNGKAKKLRVQEVVKNGTAVLYNIRTQPLEVSDLIAVDLAGTPGKQTLSEDGESLTFDGFVLMRMEDKTLTAEGGLLSLKTRVPSGTKLIVNGKQVETQQDEDDMLHWSKK
ncbi:MAG: hypothetical protein ACLFVU_05690 [Phycisphaerae bacterium]